MFYQRSLRFSFMIIFFDIPSVFGYFRQAYYDTYFFHISLYIFLQIILCIYFLLFLLILHCYFHNNLLFYLLLFPYFFIISFFIHFIYNKPLFSFKLEFFIIFIVSFYSCTKNEFYNHFL